MLRYCETLCGILSYIRLNSSSLALRYAFTEYQANRAFNDSPEQWIESSLAYSTWEDVLPSLLLSVFHDS
jgi:hypothetical protein